VCFIYTYEFEKFRQEARVSISLCLGADPESKGKIENTVKYIKGNFLSNRMFVDDDILNSSCEGISGVNTKRRGFQSHSTRRA